MVRAKLSLFRKKPAAAPAAQPERRRPEPLPDAVRELIDASGITPRPSGSNGEPRPLLFLSSRMPIIYNREKAEKLIGNIFPELTDEQLRRAAGRLHARVHAQLRTFELGASDEIGAVDRRPWMYRY